MSKDKPTKKKVVRTTGPTVAKESAKPRTTRRETAAQASRELTFGRDTYIWMGIGFALIVLGMLLMLGGHMPSPEVWEPDIIYSDRRTLLAPIMILAGLGVEIYAIFKK